MEKSRAKAKFKCRSFANQLIATPNNHLNSIVACHYLFKSYQSTNLTNDKLFTTRSTEQFASNLIFLRKLLNMVKHIVIK